MSSESRTAPNRARAGVLALLLAGCAMERERDFAYPEFEQWSVRDAALDCTGLERELRRTDAVRWSMREDGFQLDSGNRKVLGVLGVIGGVAAGMIAPQVGAEMAGNSMTYAFSGELNKLEQADRRLVRLLQRKRALGCAATPTGHSGVSDLQMLEGIEALNRRQESGEINHKAEVEARSRTLDWLRASGWRRDEPADPPRHDSDKSK
jgi:hypothetical protein